MEGAIFGQSSNLSPRNQVIEDEVLQSKLHDGQNCSVPSIKSDNSKFTTELKSKILQLRAGKTKVKKDGKEKSKKVCF